MVSVPYRKQEEKKQELRKGYVDRSIESLTENKSPTEKPAANVRESASVCFA